MLTYAGHGGQINDVDNQEPDGLDETWVLLAVVSVLSVVVLSSGSIAAQATVSAAPIPLYEVRTIYIVPSSDDFVRLFKSRLEQWGTVKVTPQVKEVDAGG